MEYWARTQAENTWRSLLEKLCRWVLKDADRSRYLLIQVLPLSGIQIYCAWDSPYPAPFFGVPWESWMTLFVSSYWGLAPSLCKQIRNGDGIKDSSFRYMLKKLIKDGIDADLHLKRHFSTVESTQIWLQWEHCPSTPVDSYIPTPPLQGRRMESSSAMRLCTTWLAPQVSFNFARQELYPAHIS